VCVLRLGTPAPSALCHWGNAQWSEDIIIIRRRNENNSSGNNLVLPGVGEFADFVQSLVESKYYSGRRTN